MAKRLAMAFVMVILSLTIVGAGVAVAAKPKAFQATVQVTVTSPGTQTPAGTRLKTEGEVITGQVVSSPQWPELEGAYFEAHHSSNISLNMLTGDILSGHGHGTAQLTKMGADGSVAGIFEARYQSDISGNLFLGVRDSGTWTLVRATGVFKGVQAHGDINGLIFPIGWTPEGFPILGGEVTLSGVFG